MFFRRRRFCYLLFVSLYLSPLLLAAPTSTATVSTLTSLSSNPSSSAPTSSSRSHHRTQTPFKAAAFTYTRQYIPPNVGTHLPARPTVIPDPAPFRGDHPPIPLHGGPPKQKPVAIFFEVLGGIAGLALILCLFRCLYSYNRTPRRDRVADVVARHRLQREMEEIQQRQRTARPGSLVEPPPPPYFPRPPSYAELGNQTALLSRTHTPSDSVSSASSSSSHSRTDSDPSIYLARPIAQARLLQGAG